MARQTNGVLASEVAGMVGIVMGLLVLWGVWLTVKEWRAKLTSLPWWFGVALATGIGIALIVSGYDSAVHSHP